MTTDLPKTMQDIPTRLSSGRTKLVEAFFAGQEKAFLEHHTHLLDDYFRDQFSESAVGPQMGITRNPYAIIALGGYGRQEQCVHSDVDLLFLFEKKVPADAEALIGEVLYPLWDMGLDVGHATRSIKECIRLAAKDLEVFTSILDARFVCGVSPLYTKLVDQLDQTILSRHGRKRIDALIDSNRGRHQRFGDSAYLLEPNLKEGRGGLRDYHTMRWIARIQANARELRDLEYFGFLSHDEFTGFRTSLEYIWHVRNHLHQIAGRKCDHLRFDFQEKLAETLGYPAADGQQPVERFLGELHGHMEVIKRQFVRFLYELGYTRKRNARRWTTKPVNVSDGLVLDKNGLLSFDRPAAILTSPELLVQIFEESVRLKIPINNEASRLVHDFLHLVGPNFCATKPVLRSFEKILVTTVSEFNVLNEMLNTGLLPALVPEIDSIVNRIQYDEYHLYPVDKHSLRAVQTLKSFGTPESAADDVLVDTLYKELKHRKLLLWATLLHDIGKGVPGKGHSEKGAKIAARVLNRLGYKAKDIDTVAFLIREHLYLTKTATRRDLNDEETAIAVARRIKRIDRLKMLYLLSVSDAIATGPKAWNDWTAVLLRTLFLKALNVLQYGELASREAFETIEEKKRLLLKTAKGPEDQADMEQLIQVMSPRYLLYVPQDDLPDHVALCRELGNRSFVWQIDRSEDVGIRTVTICAKDRPGLFSRIAGIFTLHNINILDAQVFTWRNSVALDVFKVQPPPDPIFEYERWARAEKDLVAALEDRLDLTAALEKKLVTRRTTPAPSAMRPIRVEIDNDESSFFTIIDVYADDYPGLLFRITDTLFRNGLDVWVAKIATQVDQVVDVFYVRDFDGQKVDAPHQEEMIRTTIKAVLPDPAEQNDQPPRAAPGVVETAIQPNG